MTRIYHHAVWGNLQEVCSVCGATRHFWRGKPRGHWRLPNGQPSPYCPGSEKR